MVGKNNKDKDIGPKESMYNRKNIYLRNSDGKNIYLRNSDRKNAREHTSQIVVKKKTKMWK